MPTWTGLTPVQPRMASLWPSRSSTALSSGKAQAYRLITDPCLVAEIADVAELYVGGNDNNLRAASVRKRALRWLQEQGLSAKEMIAKAHLKESEDA